jgi:hypothetical protein
MPHNQFKFELLIIVSLLLFFIFCIYGMSKLVLVIVGFL